MRLSEMYYAIKHVLIGWVEPTFQEQKQKNGAPSLYSCENMRYICGLLDSVRFLPEVKECLLDLKKHSTAMVEGKTHYLENADCTKIRSTLNKLRSRLSAMRSMCETLGLGNESEGFDVKLPPDITLGDAAQCMADLDTVFSQCPILPEGTQIQFRGVDIGSTWLTFVVGGTLAVAVARVIAELVDTVIAVRSHQLAYKQEDEHLRTLKLSNDVLESVTLAHKAALDKMKDTAIEELSAKYEVTENEERERLRMSIDRLGKWIDRGMEIYANINAPEETKLLFPPIERQSLPQETIKALNETSESE